MGSTRIGGGTFVTGLVALCALACVACGEADAPAPAAPRQAAPAGSPKPAPATSAPAVTPAPSEPAATAANASQPTAPKPPSELVARGRQVYMSNCTACHNMDPGLPGTLGPEITGASLELIEARVLHGAYPPGHVPKRDTKLMLALPYLAADLDALAAYLDE